MFKKEDLYTRMDEMADKALQIQIDVISEMRDLPDQQWQGISPPEMAYMLANPTVINDPNTINNPDWDPQSKLGLEKSGWLSNPGNVQFPGQEEQNSPDIDWDADYDYTDGDYAGNFNGYSAMGLNAEMTLDDGNTVHIDPVMSAMIGNSPHANNIKSATSSISAFNDFLSSITGSVKSIQDASDGEESHSGYGAQSESIKDALYGLAGAVLPPVLSEMQLVRKMGRKELVSRIRNGKVQMNHLISAVKHYKIVDGQLVQMKIDEIRARKRGAKIASRKRKSEHVQIQRNRKNSLRKRHSRFGV